MLEGAKTQSKKAAGRKVASIVITAGPSLLSSWAHCSALNACVECVEAGGKDRVASEEFFRESLVLLFHEALAGNGAQAVSPICACHTMPTRPLRGGLIAL
jgi:hypothetical protein